MTHVKHKHMSYVKLANISKRNYKHVELPSVHCLPFPLDDDQRDLDEPQRRMAVVLWPSD